MHELRYLKINSYTRRPYCVCGWYDEQVENHYMYGELKASAIKQAQDLFVDHLRSLEEYL